MALLSSPMAFVPQFTQDRKQRGSHIALYESQDMRTQGKPNTRAGKEKRFSFAEETRSPKGCT